VSLSPRVYSAHDLLLIGSPRLRCTVVCGLRCNSGKKYKVRKVHKLISLSDTDSVQLLRGRPQSPTTEAISMFENLGACHFPPHFSFCLLSLFPLLFSSPRPSCPFTFPYFSWCPLIFRQSSCWVRGSCNSLYRTVPHHVSVLQGVSF